MYIINKIIILLFPLVAILIIVQAYKKHSKQEKNNLNSVYTETPTAQMRRSFRMVIPVLFIIVAMAIFAFLNLKQTSNTPKTQISVPTFTN